MVVGIFNMGEEKAKLFPQIIAAFAGDSLLDQFFKKLSCKLRLILQQLWEHSHLALMLPGCQPHCPA